MLFNKDESDCEGKNDNFDMVIMRMLLYMRMVQIMKGPAPNYLKKAGMRI